MKRDGPWDEDGTLYAVDVPGNGSTKDSRMLLGTDGHHDAWTGDPTAARRGFDSTAGDGLRPGFGTITGAICLGSAAYLWNHRQNDN